MVGMTDGSAPGRDSEKSVHPRAPEPFPIVPVVASFTVFLVWLAANLWAQPLSDWIGARAVEIELAWIATRDE